MANDSCHTIGYLPAIDQSPTSFEVVAEVLRQSEVKTEELGPTEVAVVMDQAIYAKAVDIMLLNAFEKGKQEVDNVLKLRLQTCDTSFFSPIKELKLKTFKDTLIKRMCNVKAKSVMIAAERSMFGKLLIVAQQRREISM